MSVQRRALYGCHRERMLLEGGRCSGKQRVTPAVRVVLDDAGIHTRGHACVEAASHPKAKTKTGAALTDKEERDGLPHPRAPKGKRIAAETCCRSNLAKQESQYSVWKQCLICAVSVHLDADRRKGDSCTTRWVQLAPATASRDRYRHQHGQIIRRAAQPGSDTFERKNAPFEIQALTRARRRSRHRRSK